jgi:low temperature requirement protein LtrA
MAAPATHHHLEQPDGMMRARHDGEHARVTTFELFFDLVFVFAITQISHALVDHLDAEGA